jgi:hypothetical protein
MSDRPRRVPARLAVLCAIALAGCSDFSKLTGPTSMQQVGLTAAVKQDLRRAMTAQERHTEALMRRPGVLGTAVVLLPNGRAAVRVFLLDATPRDLPATLDSIPVDLRVTGLLVARSDPRLRLRPAPIGYSVGHPLITAGTIGARVVNATGDVFVLSNNHVLANSNAGSVGDATWQPGPFDGGTAADQIGTLAAFRAIDFSGANNFMDAAIALSSTASLGNSTPLDDGYGVPDSRIFGDANNDRLFDDKTHLLNLSVMKYGRTTKLTRAHVTGINATVDICYEVVVIFCVKSARFTDQIVIGASGFSDGGDSGSLIVTDDGNRNPVALLFAGSATETIANRIDLVLNHFNVSVDGSASEPPPPPDPVNDAQMVGINAAASIEQGKTVFVGAVVRNVGNQPLAAFDVTMVDQTDGVPIGTATVATLAVGETQSVVFSWNTTGESVGPHVLAASHNLLDDNAANNQVTRTTQVTAPPTPFTDAAVIGVSGPTSATQGTTVNLGVTVRNLGNQSVGAFDVSLQDQTDGLAIGTQTVPGLAAGVGTTLNFAWNTTGSSLGAHTLLATHTLPDDNAANNSSTAVVQVNTVDLTGIHLGDLDGSASSGGFNWSATVDITVHDASHAPIDGATVRGVWNASGLNSNTCTSGELGGTGTCMVLFPALKRATKSVTFTVTSLTMAGRTYARLSNHDPDGSSNGTVQTVIRP